LKFEVKGADGVAIEVEAVDWMMAMVQAIKELKIEVSGWVCETHAGGIAHVTDPRSGRSWVVTPVGQTAVEFDDLEEITSVVDEPPADLAEKLFDMSMDLSTAQDPHEACRMALDLTLSMVGCEAASVLRGGINDDGLTFVAASGPVAEDLLGKQLRFGQGLVGVAFDLGISVQVNDVRRDDRFLTDVDQETGFQTRSVLCVPVTDDVSFFGAIELINPPKNFLPWHIEAVETIARSLATTLSGVA